MYLPKHFAVTDRAEIENFLIAHSFATLVSTIDGEPFASHLPLLFDRAAGPNGTLIGHVARANPHWQAFDGQRPALAIFQGPHAYVSPTWYESSPAVPTWNYVVAHAYGAPRLVEDEAELAALVDRLVRFYESGMPIPWSGDLPAEYKRGMIQGIVGFTMPIERIEGKYKLSQNRSSDDQRSVARFLEASSDPVASGLGNIMVARTWDDATT